MTLSKAECGKRGAQHAAERRKYQCAVCGKRTDRAEGRCWQHRFRNGCTQTLDERFPHQCKGCDRRSAKEGHCSRCTRSNRDLMSPDLREVVAEQKRQSRQRQKQRRSVVSAQYEDAPAQLRVVETVKSSITCYDCVHCNRGRSGNSCTLEFPEGKNPWYAADCAAFTHQSINLEVAS